MLLPGDLTAEDTRILLATSQIRTKAIPATKMWPAYVDAEICLDGKWVSLGSTDLCDNVAVGHCFSLNATDAEVRAYYTNKIRLGGRLQEYGGFSVISHFTDG
jgi:hypothetical protein